MRQHRVWPREAWHFSVPVPASLGVRAGDTIHVGGQVALDTKGVLRAPGDPIAQTRFAHHTPPGSCSTGVPLPALAYEAMMTEIEAVATM